MIIILELINVVKNYKNKKGQIVEALKGVSFRFPKTGMVFIVGKSGSGKSTLLNILGLLDIYNDGEFLINGKCSKDFSEKERDEFRAQRIGFVFQEFHIIEKYSIGQNISLPLEIQHGEKNEERVKQILKKVQLEGYENRKPAEISGGQKQRIAIARAIIKEPEIVLADEPTGSLDSVTGTEIFNILQDLSKEKLVIIISHDIESAHKYANQIIELKDGLIDSIYEGDGGAESVRFLVDEIRREDIEKYNSILNQGRKVTLTKLKPKKQDLNMPAEIEPKHQNIKEVRLPFKSILRLSFFSMKSKWVRTFFTILISMFAVAFFGFTDVISSFRSQELFVQDLVDNNARYVGIGAQKVENEGFFNEYSRTVFEKPQVEEFKKLNLEAYPQRKFLTYPQLNTKRNFQIFPAKSGQFYYNTFGTFTEVDDISRLNVIKEGRAPENFNEIVITSYQMKVYKVFGFNNGVTSIDSVLTFDQIKDLPVFMATSTYSKEIEFKIVGLVEIDLSAFDEISKITEKVSAVTKEQRLAINKFSSQYQDVNTVFVKEGFFEFFEEETSSLRMYRPQFTYQEKTYTAVWNSMRKISPEIFDNEFVFKAEITDVSDIQDNQIVLSTKVLERVVDGLKIQSIDDGLFALGNVISMTSNIVDGTSTVFNIAKDLEIVGLYDSNSDLCFVSQNVINEAKVDIVQKFNVPSNDASSHSRIIKTIKNTEEFAVGEEVFRFYVSTANYNAIKTIDNYFTLFVSLFSVLTIVLFIFAIILNYTFISQSIEIRKKDIGILRSLGARKKDVAGIFVIEGIVTAIFEIIFGSITCYLGYRLLNGYFVTELGAIAKVYEIISFGFRQVVFMMIVTIIAVAIALFIPIYRISNKEPVDAIRS